MNWLKNKKNKNTKEIDAKIEELEERAKAAFGMGRNDLMNKYFRIAQELKAVKEKQKK